MTSSRLRPVRRVTPADAWTAGPPPGRFDGEGDAAVERDRSPAGASDTPSSHSGTPPAADLARRLVSGAAEWATDALPPREHLLTDIRTGRGAVDRHGVWLMGGAGGAGKSYATIGLALAVCSGAPWLGVMRPARAGRVVILAAEDSAEDIRRRVHAICAAAGIDPACLARLDVLALHDRVTALVSRTDAAYASAPDLSLIDALLRARDPYDLVIVDPIGRIAGVSIDADNAAAAAVIGALATIGTAVRGLVLGVTHTSLRARLSAAGGATEGATGIRGATGQGDYARGVISLDTETIAGLDSDTAQRLGQIISIRATKANHVAHWEPILARRGEHGELRALDAVDLALVTEARATDPRQTARAERSAARERDREARIARESAEREAAADRRQADRRRRDDEDDEATRAILAREPGITVRDLRIAVRTARACGGDRADSAIRRVRRAAR